MGNNEKYESLFDGNLMQVFDKNYNAGFIKYMRFSLL
jgi:hypothetical protein